MIFCLKMNRIILLLYVTLMSCSTKTVDHADKVATSSEKEQPTAIKTIQATVGTFKKELFANGKIMVHRKVDLHFKNQAPISAILVKNGEQVTKGQLIAQQQQITLQNNVTKAKAELEQAKIDVKDALLDMGYAIKDTITIPEDVLSIAQNRAKYTIAKLNLSNAQYELSTTTLKAPFNGTIANLNTNNFNYPDNSQPFCTIIDQSSLEVVFQVLEHENNLVEKEQLIEVTIDGDTSIYKGKIIEINPLVNAHGMIAIKGKLDLPNKQLLDGMNVSVTLKQDISNVLYVPKSSLVLRDEKKVIFTYKDGIAIWNYVDVSYENSKYVAIENGISKDDLIIYEGNVSLSHKNKVIVNGQ